MLTELNIYISEIYTEVGVGREEDENLACKTLHWKLGVRWLKAQPRQALQILPLHMRLLLSQR